MNSVRTYKRPSIKYEVITSDKLSKKISKLDVSSSFKLSIVSGLIDVGGSSKYLQSRKSAGRECAIHVRYEYLNQVQELKNFCYLQEAVTESKATHFVSKIHYGASATFTFRKRIGETEDEHQVKIQLEACGKELVKALTETQVSISSKKVTSIECQFEADFSMGGSPATYEGALDFAGKLNQKLSETMDVNEPSAGVPCIVWLRQLASLPGIVSNSPIILPEIDDVLVSRCVQLVEEYDELERNVNDMLNNQLVNKLTLMRLKLDEFKTRLSSFRKKLDIELRELVVDIRRGSKDVSSLKQFLDRIEKDEKFYGKWLAEKHKEICMVKRFTDEIFADGREKRILTFPDKKTLQEQMSKYPVTHTCLFVFTSLARPEEDELSSCWYSDCLGRIEAETILFAKLVKNNIDDKSFVFAITESDKENDELASAGTSIDVYKVASLLERSAIRLVCQQFLKGKFDDLIDEFIGKEETKNKNVGDRLHFLDRLCLHYKKDNLADIVALLIDGGMDVNCRTNNGWNLLHLLCVFYDKGNLIDIVRLLIEKGIDVNCKQNDRWSALLFLCRYYHRNNLIDIIQLLIDTGVDVNYKDNQGKNALHFLCLFQPKENLFDAVQLLVKRGIDTTTMAVLDIVIPSSAFSFPGSSLPRKCYGNARSALLRRFKESEIRDILQLIDSSPRVHNCSIT